jgi:predicted lactoylglutathione lyase
MIFVNLPVKDLEASKAFFAALGFPHNPQFTDKTAACIVFSDTIYAMLLTHDKYRQFNAKPIADARATSEVMVCLSADSRDEVNALMDAALKAGATESRPTEDLGFMFHRCFDDLDGHTWELMWMDPAAMRSA